MAKIVTTNIHELMKRYMQWYMNMMILRSNDNIADGHLSIMKEKLAEFNEFIMQFFDKFDANPELA